MLGLLNNVYEPRPSDQLYHTLWHRLLSWRIWDTHSISDKAIIHSVITWQHRIPGPDCVIMLETARAMCDLKDISHAYQLSHIFMTKMEASLKTTSPGTDSRIQTYELWRLCFSNSWCAFEHNMFGADLKRKYWCSANQYLSNVSTHIQNIMGIMHKFNDVLYHIMYVTGPHSPSQTYFTDIFSIFPVPLKNPYR